MNCSPTIAIALMLLSFTAGMFLLYKTQKEALGMFFKVAAWFVIVVSLGSIICCSIFCGAHGCRKGGCGKMEQCGPGGECSKMDRCEMGGGGHFEKRIIICKEGEMGCEEEGEAGCCKEGKECGMDSDKCSMATGKCCKEEGAEEHECGEHDKMKVVKDTVVIKRSTSK